MPFRLAGALSCGLAVLMLAGCAASQAPRQEDEAACTRHGFQAGTPQFAACLDREALARRCGAGDSATLALHIKPHPELLSCPNDPV